MSASGRSRVPYLRRVTFRNSVGGKLAENSMIQTKRRTLGAGLFLAGVIFLTNPPAAIAQAVHANTLTAGEALAGWELLWDGKTSAGWTGLRGQPFPATRWTMEEGVLTVLDTSTDKTKRGEDIATSAVFRNFELRLEFRFAPGANSGILYLDQPLVESGPRFPVALEYQILDDALHPDAKRGREGTRTVAALYDLLAPSSKPVVEPEQWHEARVVVRGRHVEHWINGLKVLEFERASPEFRQLVAHSKFAPVSGFGEWSEGRIRLQDHGNRVSFRGIKLRKLP